MTGLYKQLVPGFTRKPISIVVLFFFPHPIHGTKVSKVWLVGQIQPATSSVMACKVKMVFPVLNDWKKLKRGIIICDMWKVFGIHILMNIKSYWDPSCSLVYVNFQVTAAELGSCSRCLALQSINCLLSGPEEKKRFAEFYLRRLNTWRHCEQYRKSSM